MVDPAIRARLDALQSEVDALERLVGPTNAPRRRRPGAGVLLALAIGLIALLVPVGVFASHQFTDVSNTNTFHASIAKIKTAGITGGCSATKYCPNDNVTRGQMAAFLTRAAGRGGSESLAGTSISTETVVVSESIKVPGAGFILANASGMAYTAATTGCPCQIWMQMELGSEASFTYVQSLPNSEPGDYVYASIPNTHMFAVEGAGTYAVDVVMRRYSGSASVEADASLSLLWVPFDENGDAWVNGSTTQSEQILPH
jgi:hypothetical protein